MSYIPSMPMTPVIRLSKGSSEAGASDFGSDECGTDFDVFAAGKYDDARTSEAQICAPALCPTIQTWE